MYVLPCVVLVLCISVLLAFLLPRLGKRELILVHAFRMFDQFVLVWICRFPLPLDAWEGLRFVIVALPGLFSYLFLIIQFNLIFKHGKIWAEGKRYEWRKEQNTAT